MFTYVVIVWIWKEILNISGLKLKRKTLEFISTSIFPLWFYLIFGLKVWVRQDKYGLAFIVENHVKF